MYHRYNVQQQPFIYLNIVTARSEVDVNLTPDKRQLLLNNEKILLLALKKSLLDTFGSVPSTFQMQNISIASMLKPKLESTEEREEEEVKQEAKVENEAKAETDVYISSSQRFMDVLSQWRRTGDTKGVAPPVTTKRRCEETAEISARVMKMQKIQNFLTQESPKEHSYKSESDSDEVEPPKENPKESPKHSPNSSFVCLKQLRADAKGK